MLEIRINENTLEWSIRYRIDSVIVEDYLTKDTKIAQLMISRYMILILGLAKGKKFLTPTGREI